MNKKFGLCFGLSLCLVLVTLIVHGALIKNHCRNNSDVFIVYANIWLSCDHKGDE